MSEDRRSEYEKEQDALRAESIRRRHSYWMHRDDGGMSLINGSDPEDAAMQLARREGLRHFESRTYRLGEVGGVRRYTVDVQPDPSLRRARRR